MGNITIYIDSSSGARYWESYISKGADNWMYSGWSNPIYIKFVSSNYGSKMDFYSESDSYWSQRGILAETQLYANGSTVDPNMNNWSYAEIHINDYEFKKSSFSNEQAQGTIIHEMGHAFGLAHNNLNPYSIMCQTNSRRVSQRVQKVDNDALIRKY